VLRAATAGRLAVVAVPCTELQHRARKTAPTNGPILVAEDNKRRKNGKKQAFRRPERISVRRLAGRDALELVYPPCVRERAEDMEEVHKMLEAGEIDVAVDELRWLSEGCGQLLEAHQLLGQIALDEGDLQLARGHLGYAFELGLGAIPKKEPSVELPYSQPANQPFFKAGKALAECLVRLGEPHTARKVAQKLLALDPSDPLKVKPLAAEAGPSPRETA
jgi:tetratricopeptide (TPR) repeat protein